VNVRWKALSLLLGVALTWAGMAGFIGRRAAARDDRRQAVELAAALTAARLDASIARVETTLLLAAPDAEVGRLAVALGHPVCATSPRVDCAGGDGLASGSMPDRLGEPAFERAVTDAARESRRSGSPSAAIAQEGVSASAVVVVADQATRLLLAVIDLDLDRDSVVPSDRVGEQAGTYAAPLAHDLGGSGWSVQRELGPAPSLASGLSWPVAAALAGGVALVVMSIAGLTRDLRRLRRRATTDSLTGLPNRAEFERRAGRVLAQLGRDGGSACLVVIDLDGFKSINDLGGHAAGDRVLVAAGARLAAAVRSSDLVGRWGGDEFVLLLVDITDPLAIPVRTAAIAATLRDVAGERGRPLTASVGAAVFPVEGGDLPTLLELADRAMYAVKEHAIRDHATHEPRR
jgi:diguanylate cyclase (GGDEF)-like protein